MTTVWGAYRSVPDYHARPAPLLSLHATREGAIHALYPDRADFRASFQEDKPGYWVGPDGFGHVQLLEVKHP